MVKAILGYNIVAGMSVEEYEKWLREIHIPDLAKIPGLKKLVLNTVQGAIRGDENFITILWNLSKKPENGVRKTRFQKKEAQKGKQISDFM